MQMQCAGDAISLTTTTPFLTSRERLVLDQTRMTAMALHGRLGATCGTAENGRNLALASRPKPAVRASWRERREADREPLTVYAHCRQALLRLRHINPAYFDKLEPHFC
jgi:hypothetical protein